MVPWAFDALARRLPDGPIAALELGASSELALPREAGRVVVHDQPIEPKSELFVLGDIEDSRVLRGALGLLEVSDSPVMLVSVGGLDKLSQLEAGELIEHVIWDLGLVGALVKSRYDLGWKFTRDRLGAGRVAAIVDYAPNRDPDRWYLYAKP